MGNLMDYAKREMQNWIKSDDVYDRLMAKSVLQLIKTFEKQGHSGFSAPIAIEAFRRLASFKPFSPLTGNDDEWEKIDENTYQNKRCFSVFKDKDGNAYDVDGRMFSRDGGKTWFTNKDSSVPVTFPYVVKDNPERILLDSEDK